MVLIIGGMKFEKGILSSIYRVFKMGSSKTQILDYNQWSKEDLIKKILELEKSKIESVDGKKDRGFEKKIKEFDFSKYSTRFLALKFSYLGWNYNGLAIQNHKTALPTVEETIIEALYKARMIPSLDPKDFYFSRCGRTDKGVSAMNQVISLRVRSNLSEEDQKDPANDEKEIKYLHILNKLVPKDIRFKAVCMRPPTGFDARFSCQYRHYKYLFHKQDLDIDSMMIAAKKYEGNHDFRNFCKIDGSKQIKNFTRTILSSAILPYNDEFYVFDLKGSAFLWHQVRCMIAILFLVGGRLEKPEIIDNLFDVEVNPQRPVYNMANDIPLILYDCKFSDNVEWKTIAWKDTSVYERWLDFEIKNNINNILSEDMLKLQEKYHNDTNNKVIINVGDGKGKVMGKYVPLSERPKMSSAEEQNEKFILKKRRIQ